MKKIILLSIILLSISSEIVGQTPYYKIIGDSTRWYVSGYIYGVKPSGTYNGTDIGAPCTGYYNAIKDTLYNGKIYKKFVKEYQFGFWPCMYSSTPPLSMALIREDSLLKKVYIVHPDSVNESVAIDFNLNVGDSLYLPFATASYVLKNGYYKVDSITSKNEIMGMRKHFFLSKYNAPINWVSNKKYFIEWIESIGATHFPINIINEDQGSNISFNCKKNQYSSFVTCKFDKAVKHYQDSCAFQYAHTHNDYVLFSNNCEYFGFSGGIHELSFLNNIELYPNPSSSEQLTLKFSANEFKTIEVIIYNLMGQKVYSEQLKISTTENEIHFNNLKLNQGIYNLQIKSAKESATIKFIRN